MTREDEPKWEYRTEHHDNFGGAGAGFYDLQRLGGEGWELMGISIVPFVWKNGDETHQHNRETFYFKRRKESA